MTLRVTCVTAKEKVSPFYHDSLTTTTDKTTGLLLQSDRLVVVIVVEVFREPLLGQGLLGVLDISLRDDVVVGLTTCGGVLFVRGSSAEVRVVVIHEIEEVEGVRH